MVNNIQRIIKGSSNPKLIGEVFEFAKEIYKDKKRMSGENYIEHALRVALNLKQMGLDEKIVISALLHDAIDDKPAVTQKIELEKIKKRFGAEISELVERTSRLSKIRYSLSLNIKEKKSFTKERIENLRKMFIALAGDLRVILIELASRLDGLNYLKFLADEYQKLYAIETLKIFVPVAGRLGLGEIRRKLEDISFFYLSPEKYGWIKESTKEKYEEREQYLKKFIPKLRKILKKERIEAKEISYRAKSYWSLYQKLLKKNMDIEKIHDLFALRIIVSDIPACYKALGIMHKYFKPISEELNDYIAKPKANSYRSLHTTVFLEQEKISEIQIRTEEMHKEAEYGVCAHWSYKEKIDLKKEGKDFEWIKDMPEFWKTFKIDFFANQIFAFTPKGDVIALPKESTPVDFAYAVHSEIGNHCESAKIAGKIVPLSHILENGDIIEIVINQKRKPSPDWLKFAKTNLAKNQIKKSAEQKESPFKIPIPHFIKKRVLEIAGRLQKKKEEKIKIKKEKPKQIYLAGQKGILVHIAKCCNPQPEDEVKAYLSQHRAAVLHRISCSNFKKIAEKFPEKIIDASWE